MCISHLLPHLKECSLLVYTLWCVWSYILRNVHQLWLTCSVWIGVPIILWQLMRSWLFRPVCRLQNVPDQKAESHVPYTPPASAWRPVLLRTVVPSVRCTPLSAFSSGLWPHIFAHSSSLVPHSSLLLYPFSPCRSFCVCSALAIFRSVTYK
jgi:hypothetical protein